MGTISINVDAYKRAEAEVIKVCARLFSSTPISAVYYGRVYPDGTYIGVNSKTVSGFNSM